MKKVIAIPLLAAMLLTPLLPRIYMPDLYQAIDQAFPKVGILFTIALDVCCLWITLFLFYMATRFSWSIRSAREASAEIGQSKAVI
ncbi:hypothetical protein [Spirosoma sp. KNUC1025]|uniref:hypothetical protein n=1 Tax=Spirosoma sp. KNUC1025 TaxID=2894082 RepID=UPI0038635E92|nr:hypothetical protein LN737_20190 [Spirosoma sp. KNUC1025]